MLTDLLTYLLVNRCGIDNVAQQEGHCHYHYLKHRKTFDVLYADWRLSKRMCSRVRSDYEIKWRRRFEKFKFKLCWVIKISCLNKGKMVFRSVCVFDNVRIFAEINSAQEMNILYFYLNVYFYWKYYIYTSFLLTWAQIFMICPPIITKIDLSQYLKLRSQTRTSALRYEWKWMDQSECRGWMVGALWRFIQNGSYAKWALCRRLELNG